MMELPLHLDEQSDEPLYRQLYEQLRRRILDGQLGPSSRLPATRVLAQQLGVARVTVGAAYEQLAAEGYVVSRVGAGTFVAADLPGELLPGRQAERAFRPHWSDWGRRVLTVDQQPEAKSTGERPDIDFGFGRSFPHIFPYDIWRRLLARYLSTDDTMLSRYGSVAGFEPLREAVADYLRRLRGVRCATEQVVIVSGVQQALDILGRLLLRRGDAVLVETPGYSDAFDLFRTFGARLSALAVDDHGFPVEQIPAEVGARFAFVTPSNQFPRGGTMPLTRRLALLAWARDTDALILEDDYDGELRYSGHPLAALQGLDEDGRVVYLGTFSKVLFPALRLGYLVLPESLLAPFLQAKQLVDRGAPTLTQAAVADFIVEGHFEGHLRRLRQTYGRRRQALTEALARHLDGVVSYAEEAAGLHVMLRLPEGCDEEAVVAGAAAVGVGVYPGAPYHVGQPAYPAILLGYSGVSQEEIAEGVARLARVVGACQAE
ncbi:MAG: PLP-dependent aminotransferase family protein [Candidatus Promineifilaceae bacterium]|nr:PLP-dependent aminotransferase family protein [Candidatus Promineifilaceae bacterium]